jgi:hypothetical protein
LIPFFLLFLPSCQDAIFLHSSQYLWPM